MAPTIALPDNPMYACCTEFGRPDQPQQIRIVFENVPDYVPTKIVELKLDDAERLCSNLNSCLGLDRNSSMKLAAPAMRNFDPSHNSTGHQSNTSRTSINSIR